MAWYHVNNCSCPVGCCDCGDTPPSKPDTEEELNAKNKHVWYGYNPLYFDSVGDYIIGTPEKMKPSCWDKSWKFCYLGLL